MKDEKQIPALRFRGFDGPWEKKKLKDIGTIMVGTTPSPSNTEYYSDDGIPWVTPTDIDGVLVGNTSRKLTPAGEMAGRVATAGTILVTCISSSLGKNALLTERGGFNQQISSLTPLNKFDSEFLLYESFLWSEQMKRDSATVSMHIVNKTEFSELTTMIPSLAEQKRIGSFLWNVENLLELQQQKIKKAEQFRQAMLGKLFPAEGVDEPALRFRGFSGPWKTVQICDIANIVGGGTPDTQEPAFWNGDIDWYAPAEMEGKRYADGSERKITPLGLEKSGAQLLPANRTILFTSRAGIGKMAILKKEGATNQGFQSMVLKDICIPYFIYTMGPFITRMANQVAAGSTFLEISGKALGNLFVSIPSLEEQKKIGDFFEHLDDFLSLQKEKLEKLRRLKAALLEKLFV